MKLSKTQQNLLDGLKRQIAEARKYETYDEYFMDSYLTVNLNDSEKIKRLELLKEKRINSYNSEVQYFKQKQNAIILCQANTKTVEKLAELGYIEIIEAAKYKGGFETVKILNY